MFHYRKTRKIYAGFPKPAGCQFCSGTIKQEAVRSTRHAWIVPNRVFYDLWELREVRDHLLVIPKRHVYNLAELTEAERRDIMNILAEYESGDYNIYARAMSSKQRSVGHQHTHLIKTGDKQASASLYLKRPYLLLKF